MIDYHDRTCQISGGLSFEILRGVAMTIGGVDFKLSWTPTQDEVFERIQLKWPGVIAVGVKGRNEVLYYKDKLARQEWEAHGLTRTNGRLLAHALWLENGECWIVVDSEECPIGQHIKNWRRPVGQNTEA